MPRTITVKGVGSVSAKPDYIALTLTLESQNLNYEAAMEQAAERIEQLTNALVAAGFEKDAVKTTNFHVYTSYDNQCRPDGTYRRVFNGFVANHELKVGFDFDSHRLTQALSAIGACPAQPQLNVAFTVKDSEAITEAMLRAATANAKRNAEALCQASGVTLGELLSIDYNWGELNLISNTRYQVSNDCLAAPRMAKSIAIRPDDIALSDSAAFVWEIR